MQPVAENMVLTVAVLAIFLGAAMRSFEIDARRGTVAAALGTFERLIMASFPDPVEDAGVADRARAVCDLLRDGRRGRARRRMWRCCCERVGVYFVTVMAALAAARAGLLSAVGVAGRRQVAAHVFSAKGPAAILTGFSINSSLATAPLTLAALRRMGVSESSARLSACVGTNFNNDGITLYEAMTALFVAQAAGMELLAGAADVDPAGGAGGQHGDRRDPELGADHPDAGAEGGAAAGRGGRAGAADRLQHRFHHRPLALGGERDGRHAGGDPAGRGKAAGGAVAEIIQLLITVLSMSHSRFVRSTTFQR